MKLVFESIFGQQICSNISKKGQSCIPGMTATILYAMVIRQDGHSFSYFHYFNKW